MGGAGFPGDRELRVLDIHRDDGGAAVQPGSRDGAEADHAAAEDEHAVARGDPAARDRVEADGQRLDEGEFAQAEAWGGHEFFPAGNDQVGEGTVLLYAERLVMAAGVEALLPARAAVAAGRVGHDGDGLADCELRGNALRNGGDLGRDLVARNPRVGYERITAPEGREIGAAETEAADVEQDLAGSGEGADFSP